MSLISSCSKTDQTAQKEDSIKQEYLQKGAEIAKITQIELLKNVSLAMKKGGPGYAVEFCNLRALSLKDSLSRLHDCQIRRIALKYRNPADMPRTESEKEQLHQYQDAYQKGDTLKPAVHLFDDRIDYYKPIMISKEACLKCHGDPGTDIAEQTLVTIKEKYPEDLATGFAMNDFRGAWHITFNR
jgi:hypothetical protein